LSQKSKASELGSLDSESRVLAITLWDNSRLHIRYERNANEISIAQPACSGLLSEDTYEERMRDGLMESGREKERVARDASGIWKINNNNNNNIHIFIGRISQLDAPSNTENTAIHGARTRK